MMCIMIIIFPLYDLLDGVPWSEPLGVQATSTQASTRKGPSFGINGQIRLRFGGNLRLHYVVKLKPMQNLHKLRIRPFLKPDYRIMDNKIYDFTINHI